MGYWSDRQVEIDELGYHIPEATICLAHITDGYVRNHAGEPSELACTFCGRHTDDEGQPFAVPFDSLMKVFMDAFWSYYGRYDAARAGGRESNVASGDTNVLLLGRPTYSGGGDSGSWG